LCHIFEFNDIDDDEYDECDDDEGGDEVEYQSENLQSNNLSHCEESSREKRSPVRMIPQTGRIPPNINAILITDADNDGQNELLMGGSDRTLYSCQVLSPEQQQQQQQQGTHSSNSSSSLTSLTTSTSQLPTWPHNRTTTATTTSSASVLSSTGSSVTAQSGNRSTIGLRSGLSRVGSSSVSTAGPKVVTKATWTFPHHICSLCVSNFKRDVGDSVRLVLVGLQGGAYAVIDKEGSVMEFFQPYVKTPRAASRAGNSIRREKKQSKEGGGGYIPRFSDDGQDEPKDFSELKENPSNTARTTTEANFAPTEVISPIVRAKGAITFVATLDGHLQLVELSSAGGGGKGIVSTVLFEIDPLVASSPGAGATYSNMTPRELFPGDIPPSASTGTHYVHSGSFAGSTSQAIDCTQCFEACSLDITGD